MTNPSIGSLLGYAFARRGRNGALTLPTFAFAVVLVGLFAAVAALLGRDVIAVAVWTAAVFDPAIHEVPDLLIDGGGLFAAALGAGAIFAVGFAVYEAVCLRWLVRHEPTPDLRDRGFGADIGRLVAVHLMWVVIAHAALAILLSGYALITILALARLSHQVLGLGLVALVAFASLFAFFTLLVRFAPAAALTIARRKVSFFAAWDLTEGSLGSLIAALGLTWGAWGAALALSAAFLAAKTGPAGWIAASLAIMSATASAWVVSFGVNARLTVARDSGAA